MSQIKLTYLTGALSPTFIQQVRKQKLQFDKETLKHFQSQREAVYTLEFSSVITEKIATAALKKIVDRVVFHVAKSNNLKRVKQS